MTGETTQGQPAQSAESQGAPSQGQQTTANDSFLEALNQKFGEYDQKLSQADKTSAMLKEMQDVLGGKTKSEQKDNKKWIDKHLGTFIQAQREGKSMPITEDLVVEMQRQIDANQELAAKFEKAQRQLERLQNPQTWQDNQVFSDMDNVLSGTLERVYGRSNPEMHQMVSNKVAANIRLLMEHSPSDWERVRNNKDMQRKIVFKAVSDIVPPQAMKMMREQKEAETPLTPEDFATAWEEANQIQDQKTRSKVKELLRQKLYEFRSPIAAKPRR